MGPMPASPKPCGSSSQNPSPDSISPGTDQPHTPPIGSPTAIELAHKAAVRIACHITKGLRGENQGYLEVEMCRTAIGALPIEEKAAKGSGGHKINEYGRRLIADYGWTGGFALVWFEEYWWSRHLLEQIFRILDGKGPLSQRHTQEQVTMVINQLLDVSMAKK